MSFEIVLRREAEVDLDKIFIWYEEQIEESQPLQSVTKTILSAHHFLSFLSPTPFRRFYCN